MKREKWPGVRRKKAGTAKNKNVSQNTIEGKQAFRVLQLTAKVLQFFSRPQITAKLSKKPAKQQRKFGYRRIYEGEIMKILNCQIYLFYLKKKTYLNYKR